MVDVDLVQINFATYFRWMDQGFQRMLVELGHPLSEILKGGEATPAVSAACDYVQPVSLNDEVRAVTRVAEVGRSSFVVAHEFSSAGGVVASGRMKHVWIAMGPPAVATAAPSWLQT
jgi:acyl-CoA thioesterase FadM